MNTSTWLVAIPDEFSVQRRVDLRVLMQRAIRVEERMEKGVQVEDEHKRYQILCDRIEYFGHLISIECPVVSCNLGEEYFELLVEMSITLPEMVRDARLMSTFCPVDRLEIQLLSFIKLMERAGKLGRKDVQEKISFYQNALQNKWGVVELMHYRTSLTSSFEMTEDSGDLKKEFLALKVSDSMSEGQNAGPFITLRNQMNKCVELLRQGMTASVDFSDLRHDVIAEILHEFVYSSGKRLSVPVLYGDGSKAAPFPIYGLQNRSKEVARTLSGTPMMDVGMMSARHHELDSKVKVYWFRNQEISIGRTMGETDSVAYEKAKALFLKMRSEGAYRIGFYQTGFQPAVVGFYRALTEELQFRASQPVSLEVTPFYFLGGVYRQGKPWN